MPWCMRLVELVDWVAAMEAARFQVVAAELRPAPSDADMTGIRRGRRCRRRMTVRGARIDAAARSGSRSERYSPGTQLGAEIPDHRNVLHVAARPWIAIPNHLVRAHVSRTPSEST